ncbi:MAG: rhodanese-like domain-containing protein [Vicinamibacteria bacterium]
MNGRKISLLAAALLLVSPVARAQTSEAGPAGAATVAMPKGDRMTMADFKKLFAAGDVVVIDVRAADSYVAAHIPGALSIPEESINQALAEKLKRMGKPIATYCS